MYQLFDDRCQVRCIHTEKVNQARQQMLPDDVINSLAELFKNMGDPNRLRILHALRQQELCVCDLSVVINSSESAVSHQLRLLRTQKLVKFRRDGKVLYYSLDDHHIETLFNQGLEHVNEQNSSRWDTAAR